MQSAVSIRPISSIPQFPTQLREPGPEHQANRRAEIHPVPSANPPHPLPPSSLMPDRRSGDTRPAGRDHGRNFMPIVTGTKLTSGPLAKALW
jgi:hypothetical protein